MRNLGVTVRKASPDLMLVVHLLSPKRTYDQNYLANYIYLNIRDELLRLDGVGDISIFGATNMPSGSGSTRRRWPPTA